MEITTQQITTITQAIATGCTIELSEKKYTFASLDIGDMADLLQWHKDKEVASYLGGLPKDWPREKRFADMHDIQMRAARTEDYAPTEPGSLIQMAMLSLRKAHPKMKRDEVVKLIGDPDVATLIADVIAIKSDGPIAKGEDGVPLEPDPTEETS